jgi:hypothetical protein
MKLLWSKRKATFQYPITPAPRAPVPRTAVLVDWFDPSPPRPAGWQAGNPVQTFAEGWTPETAAFAPASLAGTRKQLLALAGRPPVLTHALIVLARPGDPLTTAAERDLLWHGFGVPVFEQIIDADGRLLAAECEAHDGLHIAVAGRAWNEYWIETSACGCGQKSPRLHAPEPVERERAAAAYAR